MRWALAVGLLARTSLALAAPGSTAAGATPAGSVDLERAFRGCKSRREPRRGLTILLSPRVAVAGQPLRAIVVSERAQPNATLVALGPDGTRQPATAQQGGGPPYFWLARLAQPATVGRYRFALLSPDGAPLICGARLVEPRRPRAGGSDGGAVWPVTRAWTRSAENLYAAWVEALFEAPAGTQPSWTPLHQVIRDPARNILYNHLGADEDGPQAASAVVVKPDCADLPYFLRAYFSFKLGLPFGYRHCDRGSSRRPTKCESTLRTNLSVAGEGGRGLGGLAGRFSRFLRHSVSYVHSGSGRTGPADDETDLYPVALSRTALRPGIVYVDPYGHLLVVAKWIPQTKDRGGLLYAVDGHPDLSVGRKRFWRGAFLFSDQIQGGAGGFKAFRPLARKGEGLVALTNAEIRSSPEYGNFSAEQYTLGLEGFYDRMDRVINPRPLTPLVAYRERLDALYELINERVGSVQVGDDWVRKNGRKEIAMPRGPKIFETSGPWEDYSTPARDMRLLIAIEEVRRFPEKVERQPRHFTLGAQAPAAARKEMEELFRSYLKEKSITYKRSDGAPFKLTLGQIVERRRGLEMAYNPNDCNEIRWAAEGAELSTCSRRAPAGQRRLMEQYRVWFASRTRPPLR